jgi:hypothetical protein
VTALRSATSKSPKWLRLSESAVGTLRILEHGCDTRLLTARKTTGGERLLGAALALFTTGVLRIDDPFGQSLMHRDVVQVTKGVNRTMEVQRTKQGRLLSNLQPGIRYCIAWASSRAPKAFFS